MNYNYHMHTWRCGHAEGREEEYIKVAIKNNMKYIGFSDHAPLMFEDGTESSYRVSTSETADYVTDLRNLREKYGDEIDIKIGFEMEYYPAYFEKMLNYAVKSGAEYLILGQHFNNSERTDKHGVEPTDSAEQLTEFADRVVEAIKTGVFSYVAHPDIINFVGDKELYNYEMRRICIASREFDVPLEINFLGIRDKRAYPTELFWKIAGEEKSPVTFGFDSHNVNSAYDGESLKEAEKLVEKYSLNYIGKPKIIDISK